MIRIGANGKQIVYGIKHYNLDTEEDLNKLPACNEIMGTTCFIISTSKYFMVNGDKQWIEIMPFGSGGSASGGNPDDNPPSDNDIIYDGGTI